MLASKLCLMQIVQLEISILDSSFSFNLKILLSQKNGYEIIQK